MDCILGFSLQRFLCLQGKSMLFSCLDIRFMHRIFF